jgi:hypothetical protein
VALDVFVILQPISISTDESKINKRIEFTDIVRNLNQFLSQKGSFMSHILAYFYCLEKGRF